MRTTKYRSFYVFCKRDGDRRSLLLAGNGLTTRRMHALRVPAERKDAMLVELCSENPGWEFRARGAEVAHV